MFTGIVECLGRVKHLQREQGNLILTVTSPISAELKIDQSVAHNGVCLTVTAVDGTSHQVTAIQETLTKTNLGELKTGDEINLERCMAMGGRLDGHIVQGHVDATAICVERKETEGSWLFTFQHHPSQNHLLVEKGSVCINGTSLTVFNLQSDRFSVAIIPYTYNHTNFHAIEPGSRVNIEYDILGKYVARIMELRS